jgi:hypothetical protein
MRKNQLQFKYGALFKLLSAIKIYFNKGKNLFDRRVSFRAPLSRPIVGNPWSSFLRNRPNLASRFFQHNARAQLSFFWIADTIETPTDGKESLNAALISLRDKLVAEEKKIRDRGNQLKDLEKLR